MLIAFDGHCVLCNGFVRFLLRRDKNGCLRFTSSDTASGAALFSAQGQNPSEPVSVILADGQQYYFESEAIIRSIAALGGGWRLIGAARIIPRALRDPAYRVVARNRYRWFGRYESCPLPGPVYASRFVL